MSLDRVEPFLRTDLLCADPVFIIGSPRSGTTALAHALGRHPALWVSKESYFLQQLYGNGRAVEVWEHNQRRATPSWLRHEEVERAEFLAFIGIGMNALYSSRSCGRRWVEQTPIYTPMVADLADMFPSATFVHILRDGRAVVRSMGRFASVFDDAQRAAMTDELPGWTADFRLACETWSEWVETASTYGESHPGRCLTVRNEELTRDPQRGFEDIFDRLGLDHHPGPARWFESARINSSFADREVRPPDRWDDWPLGMRRVFASEAGRTLVETGYADPDELARWAGGVVREGGPA